MNEKDKEIKFIEQLLENAVQKEKAKYEQMLKIAIILDEINEIEKAKKVKKNA